MTACPICDMELNGRDGRAKAHIKACEAIEIGLLADQLTPTVEEKPEGFDYPEWPTTDDPPLYRGSWRG